ncbi:hypothetical protein T439DRAFT_328841 [Meredithblackwellia eburnea MCA 4105]
MKENTILNTTAILESVLLFAFNLVLSALGQGGSVALYLTSLFLPYLTLEACKSRNTTQLIGTLLVFHPLVVVYSALSLNESANNTIGWSESGMLMKDWTTASLVLTSLELATIILAQLVYIISGVKAWRDWSNSRKNNTASQSERGITADRNYEIYKFLFKLSVLFTIDFAITTFVFVGNSLDSYSEKQQWNFIILGVAVGTIILLGVEWFALKFHKSWVMWIQVWFNLGAVGWMLFNIVMWDLVTFYGDYFVYYPNEYQYRNPPGVKYSNAIWWHYLIPIYLARFVSACMSWHAFRKGFLSKPSSARSGTFVGGISEELDREETVVDREGGFELGKV